MPKTAAKDTQKIRRYVSEFPELEYDGHRLYCPLCITIVNHEKRDFVLAHRKSKKHASALQTRRSRQPQLVSALAESTSKGDFFDQVTQAFLSADIPLEKLNNVQLRDLFISLKHPLPSESAARCRVDRLAEKELQHKKDIVDGKDIFLVVDESEVRDQRYINILFGATDCPHQTYLILCKPLNVPPNSDIVCQCVDDVIRQLDCPREKFILMQSDAARYMTAAARTLKSLYPKMRHVTCAAHLIHNCAIKIKSHFTAVDNMIARVKATVVKNKNRRALFADIGSPPTVIVTRWSSWLRGALYYSKNLPNVKRIVENYEGSGILVEKAKEAVNGEQLKSDLLAIKRDYEPLINLIEKMQDTSYTISQFWSDIQQLLVGGLGMDVCEIKPYIQHRLPQTGIAEIMNTVGDDLSPDQFIHLQSCQATTACVERSFSMLKKLLASDRRFLPENVNKYMMLYFNSSQ